MNDKIELFLKDYQEFKEDKNMIFQKKIIPQKLNLKYLNVYDIKRIFEKSIELDKNKKSFNIYFNNLNVFDQVFRINSESMKEENMKNLGKAQTQEQDITNTITGPVMGAPKMNGP